MQNEHPTGEAELAARGLMARRRIFCGFAEPLPRPGAGQGVRAEARVRAPGPRSPSGIRAPAEEFGWKKATEPCYPYCSNLFLGK